MTTFIALAAIVKVVVDRVRARFPQVDGDLVTAVAAAAGVGLAFLFGVDVATELVGGSLDPTLAQIVSGIGIGLGAGFLNDAIAAVDNR